MKNRRACHLKARKSRFVQIFRTTPPQTVCPNFYVLAHADGCMFSPQCSYCYLKSSFWFLGRPQAFTNRDRMFGEIRRWIRKDRLESYVLNMGNLSDSLSFEEHRPLVSALVELFRREAKGRPHTLLLVTKGGLKEIRPLVGKAPCENVAVSFSVNNPAAARRYERGAAPVESRLKAAAKLKKAGWRLRMRIDPMIAGYDYRQVTEAVRKLEPERVTLGSLRAEYNLPKYTERGLFAKLVRPAGTKAMARYPEKMRLAMYRSSVKALKGVCPVGLCEETPRVWDALGLDKSAKPCNCG